ncbi:MAG: polar amino acid ABC transporter permease [Chitinophagaceae bacterium]|nr:polar amino acid ABC transporter permease [Polaromonas sp.]
MSLQEVFSALMAWTPYLLGGFVWNITIAVAAMLIGTSAGVLLAWMRASSKPSATRASLIATALSRNVPTIVFQFYLAVMLPSELALPGTAWVLVIPAWVKASLALSMAVVGFTSDNLHLALTQWRKKNHTTALLFVPSWTSYALIIVIASSTASIIGVSELVSRCNAVINATGNTRLMIPMYLYAGFFFLAFCYPLTLVMRQLRKTLSRRLPTGNL